MKKLLAIIAAAMMIVTVGCGAGGGGGSDSPNYNIPTLDPIDPVEYDESLYLPTKHDGDSHYPDTEKQFTNDTMMCWAITSCNMLVYQEYVSDGEYCMTFMTDQFVNDVGSIGNGLYFFLADVVGFTDDQANSAMAVETYDYNVPNFIMDSIARGNPVGLGMFNHDGELSYGHAITVYGYDYYPSEGTFDIIYTDGDDQTKVEKIMTLADNGAEWIAVTTNMTGYSTNHAFALAWDAGEYAVTRSMNGLKLRPMGR